MADVDQQPVDLQQPGHRVGLNQVKAHELAIEVAQARVSRISLALFRLVVFFTRVPQLVDRLGVYSCWSGLVFGRSGRRGSCVHAPGKLPMVLRRGATGAPAPSLNTGGDGRAHRIQRGVCSNPDPTPALFICPLSVAYARSNDFWHMQARGGAPGWVPAESKPAPRPADAWRRLPDARRGSNHAART